MLKMTLEENQARWTDLGHPGLVCRSGPKRVGPGDCVLPMIVCSGCTHISKMLISARNKDVHKIEIDLSLSTCPMKKRDFVLTRFCSCRYTP